MSGFGFKTRGSLPDSDPDIKKSIPMYRALLGNVSYTPHNLNSKSPTRLCFLFQHRSFWQLSSKRGAKNATFNPFSVPLRAPPDRRFPTAPILSRSSWSTNSHLSNRPINNSRSSFLWTLPLSSRSLWRPLKSSPTLLPRSGHNFRQK